MAEYIFVTNIFEYSNIWIYSSHSDLKHLVLLFCQERHWRTLYKTSPRKSQPSALPMHWNSTSPLSFWMSPFTKHQRYWLFAALTICLLNPAEWTCYATVSVRGIIAEAEIYTFGEKCGSEEGWSMKSTSGNWPRVLSLTFNKGCSDWRMEQTFDS